MNLKIKNIILVGLLGAASGLVNAGLINDVPYEMRDLHTFFSPFKDYKKLGSQEVKQGRIDVYYSPSSITPYKDSRGNWEEYIKYSVVVKTANKYGYALERMWLECGSNSEAVISSRLYYSLDHQVLPQARQKIIAGSNPTFKIRTGSSVAKLQNIICQN